MNLAVRACVSTSTSENSQSSYEPEAAFKNSEMGATQHNLSIFIPFPEDSLIVVTPVKTIIPKKIINTSSFFANICTRFHYWFGLEARPKAVMTVIYDFVNDKNSPLHDTDLALDLLSKKLLKECHPSDIRAIVMQEQKLLQDAFGKKRMTKEFVVALYKNDLSCEKDARWLPIIVEMVVGAKIIAKAAREYAPVQLWEGQEKIKPRHWLEQLNNFFQLANEHRLYQSLKEILGSDEKAAIAIATYTTKAVEEYHEILGREICFIKHAPGLFEGVSIWHELTEATMQYKRLAYLAPNVRLIQSIFVMIRIFPVWDFSRFVGFVQSHQQTFTELVENNPEALKKALGESLITTLQVILELLNKCSLPEHELIMSVIEGLFHKNLKASELNLEALKKHLPLVRSLLAPDPFAKLEWLTKGS